MRGSISGKKRRAETSVKSRPRTATKLKAAAACQPSRSARKRTTAARDAALGETLRSAALAAWAKYSCILSGMVDSSIKPR